MDRLVTYLEKLGYTVEEQGKLAKFLVVMRGSLPIGFIFKDYSLKLVEGAESYEDLKQVIAFVRKNRDLEIVKGCEYLILNYRGSQLTTYYDAETKSVRYASYMISDGGEAVITLSSDYDSAVYTFVKQTGMIKLNVVLERKQTFGERIRTRLLNYLLNHTKKAEQS